MGLLGNLFGDKKETKRSRGFFAESSPEEELLEQLEEQLELLQEEQEEVEELLEELDYDPAEEGTTAFHRQAQRRALYRDQLDELQHKAETLGLRISELKKICG